MALTERFKGKTILYISDSIGLIKEPSFNVIDGGVKMKNRKIQTFGIVAAVIFVIAAYIRFLMVDVVGFFACIILACSLGIVFGDKDK